MVVMPTWKVCSSKVDPKSHVVEFVEEILAREAREPPETRDAHEAKEAHEAREAHS